jgi:5'-deoxynucleotidase YfbR-like HD superfamily hydrolase
MFEQELRDLSFVPRWGIVRTVNKQSVAEHSYYVVVYTRMLCEAMRLNDSDTLEAVTFAMWHDVPERVTGDLPGPVKKSIVDEDKLGRIERIALMAFDGGSWCSGRASNTVAAIVKAADYIDQCFFLATEIQMGNYRNARWILDSSLNSLKHCLSVLGLAEDSTATQEILHNVLHCCEHPPRFPSEVFDV